MSQINYMCHTLWLIGLNHRLWVIPSGFYTPMLSFAGSAPSEIQFSRIHSRFVVPSSGSSDDILCARAWWRVSDSHAPCILNVTKFTKSKLSVYRRVILYSKFTMYISLNFKNPYHMFWVIRRNWLIWIHCGCWNWCGRIVLYLSRYLSVGCPILLFIRKYPVGFQIRFFTGPVIRVSAKRFYDNYHWGIYFTQFIKKLKWIRVYSAIKFLHGIDYTV